MADPVDREREGIAAGPAPGGGTPDAGPAVEILLVEDDEIDTAVVSGMLARARGLNANVSRLDRLDRALARLAEGGVDIVVLDLVLPDSRGVETFEKVRAAAPGVPIVVITASSDEALAISLVRGGAQDYLTKEQLTVDLLGRSIQYSLERHRLLAKLQELSLTDGLTGLHNRRGLLTLAARHIELARRDGQPIILLYGDLDGLKGINDRYGHYAGDVALVEAAEILRRTFRSSDLAARLGGDEFVVLALEASSAETLTARLRAAFDAFNAGSGLPYRVSLSMGVVQYHPADLPPLEQLLAEADRALYARKHERKRPATPSPDTP